MEQKRKWFYNTKLYPLYSFMLTIFTFLLSLVFLDILGYGNNTILRSDLFGQYFDFIHLLLDAIKGETNFWYSFSIYLGSGSILTHAYYSLCPLNLLYLIPGSSIPVITTIIILIKLGLSSAAMEYFLRKGIKCNSAYTILLSLCYGLSCYAVTLHYNLMWLDCLYLLPLIVYLIFKLVDNGSYILLSLLFTYLLLTNFYMGFIVCIFACITLVLYTIYRIELVKENIKRILNIIVKFAYSGIIAGAMCAVILIPTAIFLYSNMADDNKAFDALSITIPDILNTLFIGEMQSLDTTVPWLYCGIPVLLLVPFYFANKKISKKEKTLVSIVLAFLGICCIYLPLYSFMHAFDYPNYYGYRFAFLIVFILVAIAARQMSNIENITIKSISIYSVCLVVFYSAMIPLQKISYADCTTNSQNGLLINMVFIAIWVTMLILNCKNSSIKKYFGIIATIAIAAELSINGYLCISHEEHTAIDESVYNQWYYSEKEAIESIKANENSNDFYRIAVNNEESHNSPCLFGYNGITTFCSSDNYNLRNALFHLGCETSNRYLTCCGASPVLDTLLGVKHTVNLKSYYELDAETITKDNFVKAEVVDNNYSLPLGYMVSNKVVTYNACNNPFLNLEYLTSLMCDKEMHYYESISENDMRIDCLNMNIENLGDHISYYCNSDYVENGTITFGAPTKEKKRFYAVFTVDNPQALSDSPRIVSKNYGIYEFPVMGFGAVYEGTPYELNNKESYDTISLIFSNNDNFNYYCNNQYFAYYNEDSNKALYDELIQNPLKITKYTGDHIEGTVTATDLKQVLLTTIPYDKDWKAFVDGIQVETYPIIEDAFLAIPLEAGTHDIVLQYIPKGSTEGLIVTDIAVIIFILNCLIVYMKTKKIKATK